MYLNKLVLGKLLMYEKPFVGYIAVKTGDRILRTGREMNCGIDTVKICHACGELEK